MSVEEIILYYQEDYSLEDDWYAVSYTNLFTDDTYAYREEEEFIAASTTKPLIAMAYYDLVEEEKITLDTLIPYFPTQLQDGDGEITAAALAGQAQNAYPLEYVLQELITASDNTAWVMLRYYYNEYIGDFNEAMNQTLSEVDYPVEMLDENKTTTTYLEAILLKLLSKNYYSPILEFMRQADEDLFLLYYVPNYHPVKYGLLEELHHHMGLYEIDEEPVYTLAILTSHLDFDQANLFMGSINLQLAVQGEYTYYLATFDK